MSDERTPTGRRAAPATSEVGVRRAVELDPAAPLPESDPELVERIADEIERRAAR